MYIEIKMYCMSIETTTSQGLAFLTAYPRQIYIIHGFGYTITWAILTLCVMLYVTLHHIYAARRHYRPFGGLPMSWTCVIAFTASYTFPLWIGYYARAAPYLCSLLIAGILIYTLVTFEIKYEREHANDIVQDENKCLTILL